MVVAVSLGWQTQCIQDYLAASRNATTQLPQSSNKAVSSPQFHQLETD